MLLGEHVTKLYKLDNEVIHILVNANFTIKSGDFIFLTGYSGSGKSTFLKLLSGEESPIHGQIKFNNFTIHDLNESAYLKYRQNLGVIYQDYKLIEHKTVVENITFVLEALGYKNNKIRSIIEEVLSIVQLEHRAYSYPQQLSGGEKRRVTIARAIAINPMLILADEPTGDLDPYNTEIIMQILKKISEKGATIVMATHHVELLTIIPKAKYWYLNEGYLKLNNTYDDIVKSYFQKINRKNPQKKTKVQKELLKTLPNNLQIKIQKMPKTVLDNLQYLTPKILQDYYEINTKELQQLLKILV